MNDEAYEHDQAKIKQLEDDIQKARRLLHAFAYTAPRVGNSTCNHCGESREMVFDTKRHGMRLSNDFAHAHYCPMIQARVWLDAHPLPDMPQPEDAADE